MVGHGQRDVCIQHCIPPSALMQSSSVFQISCIHSFFVIVPSRFCAWTEDSHDPPGRGWPLALCNGGSISDHTGFYVKREQQILFTKARSGETADLPLIMLELRAVPTDYTGSWTIYLGKLHQGVFMHLQVTRFTFSVGSSKSSVDAEQTYLTSMSKLQDFVRVRAKLIIAMYTYMCIHIHECIYIYIYRIDVYTYVSDIYIYIYILEYTHVFDSY